MNVTAQIVLLACIPAVLTAFAFQPPRRAMISALVFAWLFLPNTGFNLPGLPDYTKTSATVFGTMLSILLFDSSRLLRFRPRWYDVPMAVWCLANVPTALANNLTLYDGLSMALFMSTIWGLPYLFGRLYLGNLEGLKELAIGYLIGGLIYVPFCLYEIRFSPNLQRWIYGVHLYWEEPRFHLGYRPIVFMSTGLEVGMWMTAATLCAYWLWVSGTTRRFFGIPLGLLLSVLAGVTVLTKSVGSILLLGVGVGILWSVRQLRSPLPVVVLIAVPLLYIGTRTAGLWSGRESVEAAKNFISAERAESLEFRLTNENILVDKALQRPFLGWGGYGRNRVYDESGRDISVTDGLWIVIFGMQGFVGLAAMTASFLLPAVLLIRRVPARLWSTPAAAPAAVLAVLLCLYMIDNLSNGMTNPIYSLAMGGLMGLSTAGLKTRPEDEEDLALGSRLRDAGRPQEAEAAYRRALDRPASAGGERAGTREGSADIHHALADLLLDSGRGEEAVDALRSAVEIRGELAARNPGDPADRESLAIELDNLARVLKALGRPRDAEEAWLRTIDLRGRLAVEFPGIGSYREQWADGLNDLAWSLALRPGPDPGSPTRAVALAEKATALFPERGGYWNTLGAAYDRAGDDRAALAALEKSAQLGGGNGFDLVLLTKCWCRLGDVETARACFRRAEEWLRDHAPVGAELLQLHSEAATLLGGEIGRGATLRAE